MSTYVCALQNLGKGFIAPILENGKKGKDTDSSWGNQVGCEGFSYTINDKTYYYAQQNTPQGDPQNPKDPPAYEYCTQQLLVNGKFGLYNLGNWRNFYSSSCSFVINKKTFLYSQQDGDHKGYNWFIQELFEDGMLGEETAHGTWKNPYSSCFSFKRGDRTFIYSQQNGNHNGYNWFIQEVLDGGKMGNETDHGTWKNPYSSCFSFVRGDRTFFYSQQNGKHNGYNWFIQELKDAGKMGDETDHGTWKNPYDCCCSFVLGTHTYFYSQQATGANWFIQELKDAGKMGDETDHGTRSEGGFWTCFSYTK